MNNEIILKKACQYESKRKTSKKQIEIKKGTRGWEKYGKKQRKRSSGKTSARTVGDKEEIQSSISKKLATCVTVTLTCFS